MKIIVCLLFLAIVADVQSLIVDSEAHSVLLLIPEKKSYVESTKLAADFSHGASIFRPKDASNPCAEWIELERKYNNLELRCRKLGEETIRAVNRRSFLLTAASLTALPADFPRNSDTDPMALRGSRKSPTPVCFDSSSKLAGETSLCLLVAKPSEEAVNSTPTSLSTGRLPRYHPEVSRLAAFDAVPCAEAPE